MTSQPAPRFDVPTLQSLAGDDFARGEAYWREGQVRRLVCGESRVTAVVDGGEEYRVTLTGADKTLWPMGPDGIARGVASIVTDFVPPFMPLALQRPTAFPADDPANLCFR